MTVAVSVTNKSQVISGSKDCNLIVWDLHTGEEIHTLAGHLGPVTCVKVSADGKNNIFSQLFFDFLQHKMSAYVRLGTTAVSGSDEKTIIVWETLRGLALTSLQLHVQFTRFDISLECSRILVHLTDNPSFPIICLHNSPAQYIKLPTYSAPARDVEGKYSCHLVIYKISIRPLQIYDLRRQNARPEGSLKRSYHLTHIHGKRNTLT